MKIQFLLAWRYLWGRKQRMLLTTLAVVFGVTLLFGLNAMIPAMSEAFRHNMMASTGAVDLSVSSASNNPFDQSALGSLKEIEGISQYSGRLTKVINLPESMGGSVNQLTGSSTITLTGLDLTTAESVRNYPITEGRFLSVTGEHEVVVPQLLADNLKLKTGDILSIPSSQGIANLEVVGILSLSESTGLDEVLVSLVDAQTILNLPDQINTIEFLFKPGVNKQALETKILTQLGDNFKSGAIQVGEELSSALIMGESLMWVMGTMALAMAGFIIFNTFRTVVAERRRDLGMLRAIGASKRTVMGLILIESLIQGILGTAIGLLLGYLFCSAVLTGISGLISNLIHVNLTKPVITSTNLIGSILLGVGFTVGSGYFPARSAMKVTPLEAMRPTISSVEYRQNNRRAIWGVSLIIVSVAGLLIGEIKLAALSGLVFLVGIVLIAPVMVKWVALLFGKILGWVYPREGRLAQGNLIRQPSRAAITASSMMIGLSICIALMAMITSIEHGFTIYLEKSLGTDYLFMPPSMVLNNGNLGANEGLLESIKATNGIEQATSLRLATTETNGAALQLIGIEPRVYAEIAGLEFSEGNAEDAFNALEQGHGLIVNGVFAVTSGVKPGDLVELKTPNGVKTYSVAGVGFDYLNAKIATGYISQADMAEDFNSTSDILLMANRTSGSDEVQVSESLKSILQDYPAFSLIDANSFKNDQINMLKKAMSAFYVMIVMLGIPGLIAMANTMSINIIERTREIGMLRAVGSTRGQIKRMIFGESVLLSLLGTTMGILVGLFLSYLLVKAIAFIGFESGYYFPTLGIIAAIVVGFSFGIIAALVPARQAAKTVIVEALQYE